MEAFDTPAKKLPPTGDQLIGLPGYRRSAVYPSCEEQILFFFFFFKFELLIQMTKMKRSSEKNFTLPNDG